MAFPPPRSGKATAWEWVGKPCRKVQPLIFKRGMLRFDSLLGARSFHALVPHTPMGFSLPAEAFSGQLCRAHAAVTGASGAKGDRDCLQSPLLRLKGPGKAAAR